MPVPIALAAAALKGAQALKTAGTVIKGVKAAGAVAQGAQAAGTVAKGAQTASAVSKGVQGLNTVSSVAEGAQSLTRTTSGLLDRMSSISDNVTSKAGSAHDAMGELVTRNNKSVTPDLGQAFEAVKPGRNEEPLGIGNSPDQNKKSAFMQGFDQGMNMSDEPGQQSPSGPGM